MTTLRWGEDVTVTMTGEPVLGLMLPLSARGERAARLDCCL